MASRDPAIPLWAGHVRLHATADIPPPAMYWFAVGMGCGILRQRAALHHARVSEELKLLSITKNKILGAGLGIFFQAMAFLIQRGKNG